MAFWSKDAALIMRRVFLFFVALALTLGGAAFFFAQLEAFFDHGAFKGLFILAGATPLCLGIYIFYEDFWKARRQSTVPENAREGSGGELYAGSHRISQKPSAMTTPSEFEGVPVSRLVDLRHELTALIKQNLYGGGSKPEGQGALIARKHLDEFVFRTTDDMLVTGSVDDLRPLKRGIILEVYSELLEILDHYARRFGNGGKAVKQGMSAIVSDPDVLGRFDSDRQAEIRAIAAGWPILAQGRFDRLHLSIRTEAGNSWAWRESQAARD